MGPQYFTKPGREKCTAGLDETLRLWDTQRGVLLSTCFVGVKATCLTTAPGSDSSSGKFSVGVGTEGGCVVVVRDKAAKSWSETFAFNEEGFNPTCLALSPCARFLGAADRIFDLRTGMLHAMCPKINPDNYYFTSKRKGQWRLHINDDEAVYDLILKRIFRKKGFRLVKPATLEKERQRLIDRESSSKKPTEQANQANNEAPARAMSEDPPKESNNVTDHAQGPALHLDNNNRGNDELDEEGPEELDEEGPEDYVRLSPRAMTKDLYRVDAISGCLYIFGEISECARPVPLYPDIQKSQMFPRWKGGIDSVIENIQGAKGPKHDSIVSDAMTDTIAYAAHDVVVVVQGVVGADLESKRSRFIQMFAQVNSISSCRRGEEGLRIFVSDGASVAVLDIEEKEASVHLLFRMHFDAIPVEQVHALHGGDFFAIHSKDSTLHVIECSSRSIICSFPLQPLKTDTMRAKTGRGKAGFHLASIGLSSALNINLENAPTRISLIAASSSRVVVVQAWPDTEEWASYIGSGRSIVCTRRKHECRLTCLDRDWMGDSRGTLWRLESNRAVALARNVHDGGPVVTLRDRVTASETGAIRVWSSTGKLLRTVPCGVPPLVPTAPLSDAEKAVPIWAVSEMGAIVDGHRVVNHKGNYVLTSAHSKVKDICFSWDHAAGATSMFATIGEYDTSVSLWVAKLLLVSQIVIPARKGASCVCCQFSFAGDLLAVGTTDGTVHILQVPDLDQVNKLDCGGEFKSAIACLAWAPDHSEDPANSENNRLAVAREDGTLFFFTHKRALVRNKPLSGLEKLKSKPRVIVFADDCEIVMCEDEGGNQVFADAVSANHIPEDTLKKNWSFCPTSDHIRIESSVLKCYSGKPIDVSLQTISDVPTFSPSRQAGVLGVNPDLQRAFNQNGELVVVAGGAIVAHDLEACTQRIIYDSLHTHNQYIQTIGFSGQSLAVICCDSCVTAIDTVTGVTIKCWTGIDLNQQLEPDLNKGGAPRLGDIGEEDGGPQGPWVAVRAPPSHPNAPEAAILVRDGPQTRTIIHLDAVSDLQLHVALEGEFEHIGFLGLEGTLLWCASASRVAIFDTSSSYLRFVGDLQKPAEEIAHDKVKFRGTSAEEGEGEGGEEEEMDVETHITGVCVLAYPGLVGNDTGFIYVWGQGTECLRRMQAHPGQQITAISALSDFYNTGIYTSGDASGEVRVWKNFTECIFTNKLEKFTLGISLHPNQAQFSTDFEEILLESFHDENVRTATVEGENKKEDKEVDDSASGPASGRLWFCGHSMDCTDFSVSQKGPGSPNEVVYTVSKDCTLCKWDVSTQRLVGRNMLDEAAYGIAAFGDKLFLLVETTPRTLVVLDAKHYDVMHQAQLPSLDITTIQAGQHKLFLFDPKKDAYVSLDPESYKFMPSKTGPGHPQTRTRVVLRQNCAFIT